MTDDDNENYYRNFDDDESPAELGPSDYSPSELRKNRLWILALTMFALIWIWVYCVPSGLGLRNAITLSGVALITARLFWWLFASHSSAKINGQSAGTGKTIERPRTLGAMIGYFLDL